MFKKIFMAVVTTILMSGVCLASGTAPVFDYLPNVAVVRVMAENIYGEFSISYRPLIIQVQAYDKENDALTYSCEKLPPRAVFSEQTFRWTPKSSLEMQTYKVTFTVSDGTSKVEKTITIKPVTLVTRTLDNNNSVWAFPSIYGNKIVSSKKTSAGGEAICLYDISKPNTSASLISDAAKFCIGPSIDNDKIAYQDLFANRTRVYDIPSKKVIDSPVSKGSMTTSIYENILLVYGQSKGKNYLSTYNLTTKKASRITPEGLEQYAGKVYGKRIAMMQTNGTDTDIYMYDMATKQFHKVSQDTQFPAQQMPDICADKIVWHECAKGKSDKCEVKYFSLSDYKIRPIGPQARAFTLLDSGIAHCDLNRIVWIDNRAHIPANKSQYELYLYDLDESAEVCISKTTGSLSAYASDVYDNKIVWTEQDEKTQKSFLRYAEVYFTPVITGTSPKPAQPGKQLTIKGRNFGARQGKVFVASLDGLKYLKVTAWSDKQITCIAPTYPVVVPFVYVETLVGTCSAYVN